jgi:3-mercaptopyruvate sulfurtransferase SseA
MDEKRKNPALWLVLGGGLLLLLAALSNAVLNRPAGRVMTPTPASVAQVERVTVEDAKAANDKGKAIFLDVRDSGSYAEGHIPGAVQMTISELQTRSSELNPKSWIITYCT